MQRADATAFHVEGITEVAASYCGDSATIQVEGIRVTTATNSCCRSKTCADVEGVAVTTTCNTWYLIKVSDGCATAQAAAIRTINSPSVAACSVCSQSIICTRAAMQSRYCSAGYGEAVVTRTTIYCADCATQAIAITEVTAINGSYAATT